MNITKEITKYQKDIEKTIVQIVNECLEYGWEELVNNAPMDTGEYISNMKIEEATQKGNIISGRVYNGEMVTTKDGTQYLLGELLENGTLPHAIPNAFGWGDIFGYNSPQYERTLSSDWHPGFSPRPHWQPAFEKVSIKFEKLIKEKL